MSSSQIRLWLIYCWHEIYGQHSTRISNIKQALESVGWEVRLECMDFTFGKRLRDQIDDKIFELKMYSYLTDRDNCIFMVPSNVLNGEAFLEEQANALDMAGQRPNESNPCIGLMYL
jgi:hypothetical protein